MQIHLNGNDITNREQLHDALSEALELPEWYGRSLDALYDCLTDLSVPTTIHVENWPEEDYMQRALAVLRDEAEERLASAYRGFVDALHVRLAASGHAIRFLVGATPGDEAPINRALLLAGLLALVFVGVNWVAGGPWWGYAIVLLAAGVAAKFLLRPAPPQAEYDPRAIPPKLRIP